MKIVELPNKILRKKSEEVILPLDKKDIEIAKKLIEYIRESSNPDNELRSGIGISAVQLGYLKRMFYVKFEDENNLLTEELLINPKIIKESKDWAALADGEGCLSVGLEDDRDGLVHRKQEIQIEGYSYLKNKNVTHKLSGFKAIVFQHEFDHLEGKLYIDRIEYINPNKPKKNEILI